MNGNDLARRKFRKRRQVYFKRSRLLQLTFGIRQDLTGSVAASVRRREEPEFGRVTGQKTEISSLDEEFRTFLHSLGNNAERFYRRLEAGHSRHRGLKPDVV